MYISNMPLSTDIDDQDIVFDTPAVDNDVNIYDNVKIGSAMYYDATNKVFICAKTGDRNAFVGYFMHYNNDTDMICIMFKDFLVKNHLNIPGHIKDNYVQQYIWSSFNSYKAAIKTHMPRVKRLKRMNLQMFNKTAALLMRENFDTIVQSHAEVFGDDAADVFKASIVTTPIYIMDRGVIKLYDFSANELKMPDIESMGNFLCFFLFKNPYAHAKS